MYARPRTSVKTAVQGWDALGRGRSPVSVVGVELGFLRRSLASRPMQEAPRRRRRRVECRAAGGAPWLGMTSDTWLTRDRSAPPDRPRTMISDVTLLTASAPFTSQNRTYVRHEGIRAVSELRSAIEHLRAETLPELPDARIEGDFAELQRAAELLDAERLRRLAEIDRRRLYERDGHLSAASWLAASYKVAWGIARDQVRVARAFDDMPQTRRALEMGDVSMSAVRLLATARDADPVAFERSEAQLVEAARVHSVADLQRVVAHWRDRVEREQAPDGPDGLRGRRRLHASVSLGGMVRVDGDLDPETGETLLTALRAVLDSDARSRGHDDDRTPAQRRADALGEICRQWLNDGS
jgi:hypothetical protein